MGFQGPEAEQRDLGMQVEMRGLGAAGPRLLCLVVDHSVFTVRSPGKASVTGEPDVQRHCRFPLEVILRMEWPGRWGGVGWVGICQRVGPVITGQCALGVEGSGRERAEMLPPQSATGCPSPMWDRI